VLFNTFNIPSSLFLPLFIVTVNSLMQKSLSYFNFCININVSLLYSDYCLDFSTNSYLLTTLFSHSSFYFPFLSYIYTASIFIYSIFSYTFLYISSVAASNCDTYFYS
jgi:hypothetical protein